MKKIIIIIIFFLILIGAIFLLHLSSKQNITGAVIIDQYSYTKAICNENNYCQDYEITCKNGEIISKKPITGAAIQQPLDWKDPRGKDQINKLCN